MIFGTNTVQSNGLCLVFANYADERDAFVFQIQPDRDFEAEVKEAFREWVESGDADEFLEYHGGAPWANVLADIPDTLLEKRGIERVQSHLIEVFDSGNELPNILIECGRNAWGEKQDTD